MKRYLSILAHSLSLLLVVAAACMWVRSEFFAGDRWAIDNTSQPKRMSFISTGGDALIALMWTRKRSPLVLPPGGYDRSSPKEATLPGAKWKPRQLWLPRFASFQPGQRSPMRHVFTLAIPYWLLILFGLAWPTWGAWQHWRRKADTPADHPLCPACGYNLHGTMSDHCPECGAERA